MFALKRIRVDGSDGVSGLEHKLRTRAPNGSDHAC